MSYNIKLTDYSLLPKRAFPLDARSHFKSFAQANKAISGNVTTVENSSETENDYKQFYIGEIITTTTGSTWKVSSINPQTVILYIDYVTRQVKWDSENSSAIISSFGVISTGDTSYNIYDGNWENVVATVNNEETSIELATCLVPFSGSGGGGSATLKLSGTAPISIDNNNNISLSLDTNSALRVNDSNQLTLSVGAGIKTVDNKITLSIKENSNLSIIDNKLNVQGTHYYKKSTDSLDDVLDNNYVYQDIGE